MHARGGNKGALRSFREFLRTEAEERNKATPKERRRSWREGKPGERTW
jgi:hypothetical protein